MSDLDYNESLDYAHEDDHFPTPEQEINWAEANDYWNEGDDHDEDEDDGQPDFGFEHDSSMASIGWGTDEDYGYYGDSEY